VFIPDPTIISTNPQEGSLYDVMAGTGRLFLSPSAKLTTHFYLSSLRSWYFIKIASKASSLSFFFFWSKRSSANFYFSTVGAGSSGAAIAARLAKHGKVVLFEAGPDDHKLEIHIPAASKLLQRSDLDWQFKTTPQKHTKNRVHNWPRGKVLGGCSSINYMLFVRGNQKDYDRWETQHNCSGWGWKDVLPYFKRLEDYQNGESELRGVGGPIPANRLPSPTLLTEYFVNSSINAGFQYLEDYNGPDQLGIRKLAKKTSHVQVKTNSEGFIFRSGVRSNECEEWKKDEYCSNIYSRLFN